MTAELGQAVELPHLLEQDWIPPLAESRRFWRYVHRWRLCFFDWWTRHCPTPEEASDLGQVVDHFLGLGLLLEYVRRQGQVLLPSMQEIGVGSSSPTVRSVCDALCSTFRSPVLRAVFAAEWMPTDTRIPPPIHESRWEKRLGDALWLLFGDKPLPLSFFGDYHQLCVANPLRRRFAPDGHSVRYERGIHYTPAAIVEYLVTATLARALANRSSGEATDLRILDPSCGCGAFLIASLRCLLQWLRERGVDFQGTKVPPVQGALNVLGSVILGTDIDEIAVAWTKRLLLLTVWESALSRGAAEDDRDIQLPDLNRNVMCRSFVDPEIPASLGQVDVIVGGPPFVRLQELYRSQRGQVLAYRKAFRSARRGQFDLYMLFIEQALRLLGPGGCLAFSLSNSFLRTASGARIRRVISQEAHVHEIVEFEDKQVYPDAVTQIALLSLGKATKPRLVRHVWVRGSGNLRKKLGCLLSENPVSHPQILLNELPDSVVDWPNWALISREDASWLADLRFRGMPVSYQAIAIGQGLQTGADDVFVMREVGRTFRRIVFAKSRIDGQTYRLEADVTRPIIRGRHVRGYRCPETQYLCIFPHDTAGKALPEGVIASEYPLVYQYLLLHRAHLSQRKRPQDVPWYAACVADLGQSPKVERIIGSKIAAARGFTLATHQGLLCHDSVLTIVPDASKVNPYLLLGILNSNVFWRFAGLVTPRMGVWERA